MSFLHMTVNRATNLLFKFVIVKCVVNYNINTLSKVNVTMHLVKMIG